MFRWILDKQFLDNFGLIQSTLKDTLQVLLTELLLLRKAQFMKPEFQNDNIPGESEQLRTTDPWIDKAA